MRATFIRRSLVVASSLYATYKFPVLSVPRPLVSKIAFCEPERPYLGCSLRSMNDSPGMMVLLVNTESPAWLAEMKVGDILLEIEGRPINNIRDYNNAVGGRQGQKLKFIVDRKGQTY